MVIAKQSAPPQEQKALPLYLGLDQSVEVNCPRKGVIWGEVTLQLMFRIFKYHSFPKAAISNFLFLETL